ncbi:MAG: tripartite tricarboxylate transporter substrate binding protein, partial [Alphaproteobacteria bacterium]
MTSFPQTGRAIRRAFLAWAACATLLASGLAAAQEWQPTRPIRLIVPYGPGGSSDVIARAIAAEMGQDLGQAVIVDNKAGGQGVIAMQETARAAPDGHTIVLGHVGTLAVNPAMMSRLPYDVRKDFLPVTLLTRVPMVFAIGTKVKATTLPEFIALAKAEPGRL